jgi:hypothetical protein
MALPHTAQMVALGFLKNMVSTPGTSVIPRGYSG